MSRPFSYNDENFTVIGNILFVHFNETKACKPKEPVVEVPPEIFKRLLGYSNVVACSISSDIETRTFPIIIVEQNGRHYIAFIYDRPSSPKSYRYYYCFYLLKDI